jgi:teichuronic acid biosynthesis glycosyltransferase TuaC
LKILFLTKRRYTGKDLVNDRYGRLFEFVAGLSRRGHRICLLCIEYGPPTEVRPEAVKQWPAVEWHLHATGRSLVPGLWAHVVESWGIGSRFQPELVLSASDAFNVWLGDRLAHRLSVPHVADLYDNFESFGATSLPGVKWTFRRALRRCKAIVAVSTPLASLVSAEIRPRGSVIVVGNGVDPRRFHHGDRGTARQVLGLPADGPLIGTAGSLSRSRGIGELLAAFEMLWATDERLGLVLAGQLGRGVALPKGPGVFYFGDLRHEQVPQLLHALDVGVVCNRDSAFGRYCYPQKSVEMLSCGLPMVMADVGVARELMGECDMAVYRPGDVQDLVRAITWQLKATCIPQGNDFSWHGRVAALDSLLQQMVAH